MRRSLAAALAALCVVSAGEVCAEPPPPRPSITKVTLKGQFLESEENLLQVLSPHAAPGLPFVADAGPCPLPEDQPCASEDPELQAEDTEPKQAAPSTQPSLSDMAASQPAFPVGTRRGLKSLGTVCRIRLVLSRLFYWSRVRVIRAQSGVELQIRVMPKRLIRKVYVTGNWPLFEEEILRLVRFRPSQPLPDRCAFQAEVAASTRRIKDFLASQGYFHGGVAFIVEESQKHGPVNIHIRLALGRRSRLGSIHVEGNTVLAEPDIERIFRHRPWYTLRLELEPFTTTRLKEDLAKLTKQYNALGYPAARVRSDFTPEKSIDRATGRVNLTITVREGRRLEVVFEGNNNLSAEKLRNVLTFNEAGSLDEFEMEESANRLRDYYQSEGYFLAKVTFKRKRLEQGTVRVTYTIVEGPRLRVKSVT